MMFMLPRVDVFQSTPGWHGGILRSPVPVFERRPRVSELAASAGVSTATVDRVINGRGGVRQKTVARVEEAIREIAGQLPPIAPVADPAQRFDAVLSGERGGGTKALADAFARAAEAADANVEISFVETMNPAALAERLRACARRGSSGVAIQVLDHALDHDA